MKKILISTSIILTMLFSFIIDSSLQVSASSPDLSKYDYVYDFSEFGGYLTHNIVFYENTEKEFYSDADNNKIYTNMPYCAVAFGKLYSVDTAQHNGDIYTVLLTNSSFDFKTHSGTVQNRESLSWNTITFNDDSYSNNVNSTVCFTFGWGGNYQISSVDVYENYTSLGTMFNETSLLTGTVFGVQGDIPKSNVLHVTNIKYANFSLNDYMPEVKYDDLTVTYEFRENPMGTDSNKYQHVFRLEPRQDMYVAFTAYNCPVDLSLSTFKNNRIFKYTGVSEERRAGTSNINMKTAEKMVKGEIEFSINEYDDAQKWFNEDYFPKVKKAYDSYVSTLGFFDKFSKDGIYEWAYKTDYAFPYQTVTTYYTDNFLSPYKFIKAKYPIEIVIPHGSLTTEIGQQYHWAVTYGNTTGMSSDMQYEADAISAGGTKGPFLKTFSWVSPADSNGSFSIVDGLDKNDFFVPVIEDDNGGIVWNGSAVNGSPNGKSSLDYAVDDFIARAENGAFEGFDLTGSLKNMGASMTGFFSMMSGFFSFVPAVIWGLLATLLTLCIVLRVLGR